ncbi:mirror-image polydactyly gene 1 protein isoform X2 [Pygocentrus nattereri]|uniref:mirror-image polydactyly gene 1 protein isoform X2 n=1 Tax=Pygocentrus nattereri TaxID=42514 RepID=UPI001890D150|nr:mirror-image polydactyly gene 1 protein isoform X2 [Pygocentrus nattereri]
MNFRSMAHDVKNAVQRAKHKISSLENELYCVRESCSESEEELRQVPWKHKQELKDSLVDMYKANPKVNEELKQRLPSPVKRHCSETTPQLGFSSRGSSPDIFYSASETKATEKRPIRELNTPTPRPEPVAGPPPPPPPPPPAPVRSMEEGRQSPQRALTQQALDREELDNSLVSRPHCSTPEPPPPRSADDDQGNSSARSETKRQIPVLDKEKNIAFLLKELDSLRELNKKLQDKLALKEKELETMQLDSQLQETELEAHACERAAVLVEEIYKAQRERDQAVMARLRLANEERDEALLRAKKLQEAALELENINPEESDMDLEELLNRVSSADSALSIERSGMAIMERIQKARERRSKITSEEMKTVIEERDSALTRCKRLEQELLQSREPSQTNSIRQLTTPNNQERVRKIQVELQATQRERDMAVELNHKLEAELQSICSAQPRHEFSRKEPSRFLSSTYEKDSPAAPNQTLLNRLQQVTSELQSTQTQLRLTQESESEATAKVQKLERLVEVLRKKVGTGSVRTVI